ncbi:hypothetical protein ACIS7S_04880 [Providencia sp. DFU6]|uniref:hypothetical protein n=1 Tax=Providencia TaxID=586 RepID=UPI003323A527
MEYEHNRNGKHYPSFILVTAIIWIAKKLFYLIKKIYLNFKNRKKYEKYKGQKI